MIFASPSVSSAVPANLQRCLHCGVRSNSVCGVLSTEELAGLAAIAEVRSVPRGQMFIEEGETADAFFNISGGTAKLCKTLADGRQQVTGFARSGHFLGLASSEVFAFGAEAIEPLGLCRFPRWRLEGLLARMPHLERRLLEIACHDLARAQSAMLLLGRKTAIERVATFLLDWGAVSESSLAFRLPMTRGDIADHVGMTVETVSRAFSRLRTHDAIETIGSHTVRIVNSKTLRVLAGEALHGCILR